MADMPAKFLGPLDHVVELAHRRREQLGLSYLVVSDREFEVFPVHCVRGTVESEVVPELQPLLSKATLIRKRRYSGFFETDLEARLRAAQPEQVTVVGVCTDICVLHTVADLRNRDYRVVVPAAAVETFDAPGHPGDDVQRWALAHLTGVLGARVV